MSKCLRESLAVVAMIAISLQASVASAEEPDLVDIVRNPLIGNYKAYAEFKMAHYDTARAIWEALAQRGNAEANFNLGILHEDGLGVPPGIQAAVAHYEKAAVAGSSKAQYRLGLLYSVGAKIARDEVKADRWLAAATAQGDQDAVALLAAHGGRGQNPKGAGFPQGRDIACIGPAPGSRGILATTGAGRRHPLALTAGLDAGGWPGHSPQPRPGGQTVPTVRRGRGRRCAVRPCRDAANGASARPVASPGPGCVMPRQSEMINRHYIPDAAWSKVILRAAQQGLVVLPSGWQTSL